MRQWPTGRDRFAIDLGCGPGSETLAMLAHGWRVLAVDAEPEAIDILRNRVPAEHRDRLQTVVAPMHEVDLPHAELVHAGFSLPFCSRPQFAAIWQSLTTAVADGGRFAGQLFGERDSWAGSPGMTFLAMAELEVLLDGWTVESLEEVDEDGTAVSGPKHWHLWHVIARRPPA